MAKHSLRLVYSPRNRVPSTTPTPALESGWHQLHICAIRAASMLLLQKTTTLADHEFSVLVKSLRATAMIADETGNLLPKLFSLIHRETIILNEDPTQFSRIMFALDLPDINAPRCIRADAMESLAKLVKATACIEMLQMRASLNGQVDLEVHDRLLIECQSFRIAVKREEQAGVLEEGDGGYWARSWHNPIALFMRWARAVKTAPLCSSI